MEGFINFKVEKPPVGLTVIVKISGYEVEAQWGVETLIDGAIVTAWSIDPTGQLMPLWWKNIELEEEEDHE